MIRLLRRPKLGVPLCLPNPVEELVRRLVVSTGIDAKQRLVNRLRRLIQIPVVA